MIMKYLSLILVCFAVKCDNIGNNYFVVKMPEDNLPQKEVKKPFQVYWNVPTMQCASKKIPFQHLYEKYGIIQNDNDNFIGNKIVIIYDEIDFPAIKKNKTSGSKILINGGVPQKGNLESHLIAFENDLNKKIPDLYFDGIAVIDFESWRPVFGQNFGGLASHKHLSIEIEKDLHNWWPKMWIEKEASLRFEAAARRFMQTTLSIAKEKRPNALWGYYGFPYCFNMRRRDMVEKCVNNIDKENDSIYWLWAESTALFPSLYSSVSLTSSQLSSLIKGRIREASRVRGRDIPILPYFWYRYTDAGFMSENDLEVALTTLYQSNASGFIIWGSSNDVNTVDKCNKLFKYVETVLGPRIAKYTKQIKRNIDHLENEENYSKEPSTVYDGFFYSQSTQSLNTDSLFSTESTTDYNKYTKTESSQTLNNEHMSSTESTDYTNSNSDTQIINHFDETLSLLGPSTNSEYININLSLPTLNNNEIVTTESAIVYDKHTDIDENSLSSNNDDLFSFSSKTSTPQTLNNDEISIAKISTENYVDTNNNDHLVSSSESLTFDHEHVEYSTISSYNNENSSKKMKTFDYSDRGESSQTLNYDISNEEATIGYNEYSDTEDSDMKSWNKDNTISTSETSTFDYENSNHSTTTLNNDDIISSSESFKDDNNDLYYNYNNDEMFTTNNLTPYSKFITTGQNNNILNIKEIFSKGTSTNYDDFVSENQSTDNLNNVTYIKKTSTALDEISYTEENKDILNYDEIRTKNNDFKSTENVILNNNTLPDSSNDYLIEVDNSKNIETFKQSEYEDSKKIDEDYLIIVPKFANVPKLSETVTESELETVYDTTQADNNHETVTKSKHFRETTNDLVVTYIDKKQEFKTNEVSTLNEVKSFHNIYLLKSYDDTSDFLIKIDNSTNIEAHNEWEHTNITNTDNDYLVIVTNLNNNNYEIENILDDNLNLDSTTQTEADFVSDTKFEDIDPIVAYINKTVNNMKIQNPISTEEESLSNINLPNSEENTFDYLIRLENYTNNETSKQYEYTESTIADKDYIIIIKNRDE